MSVGPSLVSRDHAWYSVIGLRALPYGLSQLWNETVWGGVVVFLISKTAISYWGSPLLPAAWFSASRASEWKMIPSLSPGVPLGMWSLLPRRWRWWLRQGNAAAVPGVDGRWQEELLKGEWCSEPAPPWLTGIIIQQISALPLTGEQLRCWYQFPG